MPLKTLIFYGSLTITFAYKTVAKNAHKIAACDNADLLTARVAMTDAPPFDPPYFIVEKTEQGVRIVETCADGSRQERAVPASEAAGLLVDISHDGATASVPVRSVPKKGGRSLSGMPPGSTLLAVPFAEKDAAKKLGARWNAERRSWYVPPSADVSPFSRWRTDKADS